MASGEFLKVNVKCQTGRDVRWTAPLFLAGNETPSWKDNAGSLTRRVVTLPFTVPVTPDDRRRNPDLPRRLAEEVPALIVKCNRAYRQRAIASPAHLPLPESIASTTRDVLGQTSTLAQFLAAQDRVEVGPGLTCRWTDFLAALREYERELRVPAAKSSSAQMGSSMMTDLALAPSGCRRAGTDLLGCRLVACDFGGAGMGGAGGSGGGGGIA